MKKDIRSVRKNIVERKKKRVQGNTSSSSSRPFLPPQDEEVHGFPPLITPNGSGQRPQSEGKKTNYLGVQVVLAVLLFATVAIGKNTDVALLDGPEQWVSSQLQDDFPFAKVSAWYSDRFGDALEVISDEPEGQTDVAMPVNGSVTTSFQNDGKGIRMAVDSGSPIQSVKEGTVVFAGNDEDTGKTVILQHEDGSKSIYGFLSDIEVYLYENVPAEHTLGTVQDEAGQSVEIFFGIEKNDQYVDPVKVIKVDESS